MKHISALFAVFAIIFAVVIGAQTRPWSWGPSLICLGFALLTALPTLLKETVVGWKLVAFGTVIIAWFAFRAVVSPVVELGEADLLLLAAAVGTFVVTVAILKNKTSETIFFWGICLLLAANVVILGYQARVPSFNPVFHSRPVTYPSGFFGHYNECANFLVGAGFLLLGPAIFGTQNRMTRMTWGTTAVIGVASVYFTLSRGGILAAGIATALLFTAAIAIGLQARRAWAKFLLIAFPIAAVLAVGVVYYGWSNAQAERGQNIEAITDNSARLYLYGIAVSCIMTHPWAGGGSRSFSWECNQFWNFAEHGFGFTRPEMVHNELLQSVTDYGIVGGILIVILLCWTSLRGLYQPAYSQNPGKGLGDGALAIGGLAGLGGMLVQSTFSFVFHLLPGVLLLGICLACLARSSKSGLPPTKIQAIPRISLAVLAGIIALASIVIGWKGSRVFHVLQPILLHSPDSLSFERKDELYTQAIDIWPQAALFESRAATLQREASENPDDASATENLKKAVSAYNEAIRLHPFNPVTRLNQAGIFAYMGDDDNAEKRFKEGIALQGGLEAGYKGRLRYCQYLIGRGEAALQLKDFETSVTKFYEALETYEERYQGMDWFDEERALLQRPLVIGLGMAQDGLGDKEEALESFQSAHGGAGHYHASLLLSQMAETKWKEREPAQALALFRRSRNEMEAAMRPDSANFSGTTETQKKEILDYLGQRIEFLAGAGIQ
jgi:O-antigen ligase